MSTTTTTDESPSQSITDSTDAIDDELAAVIEDRIAAEVERRVDEATADLRAEIEELRDANEALRAANDRLRDEIDDLRATVEDHDLRFDAASTNRETLRDEIDAVEARVGELQSRELEKGAHLARPTEPAHLDVEVDHLERFRGNDGREYVRLPDAADPLERSGTSQLASGDLLPIQQLARMDDDMLASNVDALPVQLAAKCWRERTDEGRIEPWQQGCNGVRHYLDASDLRRWIRRVEEGITETYGKKLARRTMDALQDLTKDRTYQQKQSRRKDGLQYKETRLILPSDSDIPGEHRSLTEEPE